MDRAREIWEGVKYSFLLGAIAGAVGHFIGKGLGF
jgi:hypothetical protein